MLRDAEMLGYRTPDLSKLYDRRFVRRLDQGSSPGEIDPYTEGERAQILEGSALCARTTTRLCSTSFGLERARRKPSRYAGAWWT